MEAARTGSVQVLKQVAKAVHVTGTGFGCVFRQLVDDSDGVRAR